MDNIDLEKENSSAMANCMTTAIRLAGKHARSLVGRLSKWFSQLSCMNIDDVNESGRQYSRRLDPREKRLVIQHIHHDLVRGLNNADALPRSSSYDSLADETLSMCASSPATSPFDITSVSSFTGSLSHSSDLSKSSSLVTVTPYSTDHVTTDSSPRSDATYIVVSPLELPNACKLPCTPSDSEASSSEFSSPVSYYRSSTDLNVEDIEDDEFWDLGPKED